MTRQRTGPASLRVLVCGGRDYRDAITLVGVLDRMHRETPFEVVIHGNARGADRLARDWAITNMVHHLPFSANWEQDGLAAGPIRNQRMLEEGKPDLVVAFPGGRGTADMVRRAKAAGIKVEEQRT